MKKDWIDFKALRSKLNFGEVLKFYGVELKCKGTQHHGFCPLPNHNGTRNSPSFSANLEKGIFQCFGCGTKGNVLEFAAFMESVDPGNGGELRNVALKLNAHFFPQENPNLHSLPPTGGKTRKQAERRFGNVPSVEPQRPNVEQPPEDDLLTVINQPLDFELKGLNPEHPYLLGRGFLPETIKRFGLGFCSRGLLKNRVVIPLLNASGALIGYAGRVVDDETISEENPRYRFPGTRKRDELTIEFRKTQFLYNGHRITSPVDNLIIVEGFTSVWWLEQNAIMPVVATMGADCSDAQAKLIVSLVKPGGRIWIVPDDDSAGLRHALALLAFLSPYRFVRWVKILDGKQPTDLSKEELHARFTEM